MDATVEAGVTRQQLNEHLRAQDTGLHFPVDPGADASLGGMAATRASGSAAVGYGTMRDNVLGLKAVFADGTIVEAGGRARKSSAGYDLTALLVGTEGTLALITEVTLRLAKLPAAISAAVCPFADLDTAVAAAIDVLSAGIPVARLELLDEVQMRACNQYAGLDYEVAPTLFFEFHGTDQGSSNKLKPPRVRSPARRRPFPLGHGRGRARALVAGALRCLLRLARASPRLSRLRNRCLRAHYGPRLLHPPDESRAGRPRLSPPLFGHVGDGNFHVVCLIEPGNAAELAQVQRLGEQIVEWALQAGGTCTGEHGIGLGKIDALEAECGPGVEVMRRIKKALDPDNLMNPGKILRI